MESFGGVGRLVGDCIVRKKRSTVSYKPCLDPQKYTFPPLLYRKGSPDKNQINEEKVVLSDGQGSENKPKKFKLKLGGVTHTIHTDYKMKPRPQDNVGGSHLCSNEGKGFGLKQNKHSIIDSSSRKDFSVQGKVLRASAPRNNEQVKSKQALKRCVLDSGFREYKPPRLGKESRKKSRSEKVYSDYSEEDYEEVLSDDEPESHGKKLKRRTLTLLQEQQKESTPTTRNRSLQSGKDILTGSASGFLDPENDLLPAPSKRKKGKISEVEQQLKKAEATERRKMQLQKAARKAEDDAIRKILGQDSRKKKEEKLKQQRDELMQAKAGSSVTLAPNTVRWFIGPNGTIITFSDDIGLPDIFTPVLCSYPPPREKCAGPNCMNAYKYRDSKSKLPLCSLHCYRAIHQKMQPLIAC